MSEFSYEVVERFGVLSERPGWTKEFNLVSWNGRDPKYDIREWAHESERMGKGITMTREEAFELMNILQKIFQEE